MPAYYVRRKKPVGRPVEAARLPIASKPKEEMGLIDGRIPDSIEEWRVYLSLVKYKIPFQYQVTMAGGRDQRGGVVLDFLAYNPQPIPLPVHGKHWHKDDETLVLAVIAMALHTTADYVRDHIIWDYEIPTQQDSDRIVKLRVSS